jgi:broad specificity phosphatase PhoE
MTGRPPSAAIPEGLARTLAVWPRHLPASLLLRHSDRESIPHGEHGHSCPLTETGVQRAEALGRLLGGMLDTQARTSPLPRCVTTVQAVGNGAGIATQAVPDSLLGEPGPYVYERSLAGPLFLERGTEAVVWDLVDGVSLPGIRTCEDGARLLFDAIVREASNVCGCRLYVSHDAIVIPFLHWATAGVFPARDWLAPLDGALLVHPNEGAPELIWNGLPFAVPR